MSGPRQCQGAAHLSASCTCMCARRCNCCMAGRSLPNRCCRCCLLASLSAQTGTLHPKMLLWRLPCHSKLSSIPRRWPLCRHQTLHLCLHGGSFVTCCMQCAACYEFVATNTEHVQPCDQCRVHRHTVHGRCAGPALLWSPAPQVAVLWHL